jgi:hypothetical protein
MVKSDNSVDRPKLAELCRAAQSRVHAWLSPGQDWLVQIDGVEVVVRLVERRGRRARIAVESAGKGNVGSQQTPAATPSRGHIYARVEAAKGPGD